MINQPTTTFRRISAHLVLLSSFYTVRVCAHIRIHVQLRRVSTRVHTKTTRSLRLRDVRAVRTIRFVHVYICHGRRVRIFSLNRHPVEYNRNCKLFTPSHVNIRLAISGFDGGRYHIYTYIYIAIVRILHWV